MRGGVRSRRRDLARSRSVSGTGPPRESPADAFRERSPRGHGSQPRLKQHSAAVGDRGSGPLPPGLPRAVPAPALLAGLRAAVPAPQHAWGAPQPALPAKAASNLAGGLPNRREKQRCRLRGPSGDRDTRACLFNAIVKEGTRGRV